MNLIPPKKPQQGLAYLQAVIDANRKNFLPGDQVLLIGVRGYFLDSMGAKGKNDRGLYDDALFWIELSSGRVHQYNGNVDPSAYRAGQGTGSKKGMASLKNGLWRYKPGMHNGSVPHMAFRQAVDVTVIRDGKPSYEETGQFGINIHRGGRSGTSSLGCQTLPQAQWEDFKKTGYDLLAKHGQKDFPYILCEMQG